MLILDAIRGFPRTLNRFFRDVFDDRVEKGIADMGIERG
jgi:hypothetical protein